MCLEAYMQSSSSSVNLEVIKATAGAGKTQTLVEEVLCQIQDYYVKKQVFPRVAVATFTRKATREMKERLILQALRQQNPKLTEYISYSNHLQISTIHGILYRFLKMHSTRIGLSPGFTIAGESESEELFLSVLKEELFKKQIGRPLLDHYYFYELQTIVKQYIAYKEEYPHARPFTHQELQSACQKKEKEIYLTDASASVIKKEEGKLQCNKHHLKDFVELSLDLQKLGDAVLKSWKQKKKELAGITLMDLEGMVWELIEKQKNTLSFFKKWDFWFVDEYQDTSVVQDKILGTLTKESRLFMVGDPRQSIYRFRKAHPGVFLKRQKEAEATSGNLQTRNINFRSEPELVAFFNDFFNPAPAMQAKESTYDSGRQVAHFIQVYGEKTLRREEALKAEFQQTLKKLKQLQKVSPNHIAILSRQNSTIHALGKYLKKEQVPFRLHSAGHFTKRREVQDALLLLRFLCNPHHGETLMGLLRTPYWRIPDGTLVEWVKEVKTHKKTAGNTGFWSFCLSKQKEYPVITLLSNYLKEASRYGIPYSFQQAIETSGLMDLSYYQDPTGLREANLWKLIYHVKKHEQIAGMSGGAAENSEGYMESGQGYWLSFVDNVLEEAGESELGEWQSAVSAISPSGVELMTVHSAKGLQFDHVILLDLYHRATFQQSREFFIGEELATDRIPTAQHTARWGVRVRKTTEDTRVAPLVEEDILDAQKTEELKEGDRLLYVALTRAKKTVTMISAGLKPEAHSWASRQKFFKKLTKSGVYKTPHYSYQVDIAPVDKK